MKDLVGLLARAGRDLDSVAVDITGGSLKEPEIGWVRIFPHQVECYKEAGHIVRVNTFIDEKGVTVIDAQMKIGDPQEVARRVRSKEFFPKSNND